MTQSPRESPAPWVVAGVAGAAFVALAVVFFAVLLPYRRDHHPSPGSGDPRSAQFTSDETKAILAASTEGANILSYRRDHFEQDWQRALNGATGALRQDVVHNKSATLQAMTKGKFDLQAKVVHSALVGPAKPNSAGKSYVVLVAVNGYKSNAPELPTPQNLQITVVKTGGKWLAEQIVNVSVS
jgi:hypothetical protein